MNKFWKHCIFQKPQIPKYVDCKENELLKRGPLIWGVILVPKLVPNHEKKQHPQHLDSPSCEAGLVQAEMSYLHFDLRTGGQTFSTAFVDKSAAI